MFKFIITHFRSFFLCAPNNFTLSFRSATYVADRLEELEQIAPSRAINYRLIEAYCTKPYYIVSRRFEELMKGVKAETKVQNGKDYDKFLDGLVDCEREEYVLGETDKAKKIKEGLRASISAYEVVKRYTILGNNPELDNVVSYLGNLNDIVSVVRKIYKNYLEVDKLNSMGYERIKATVGEDLVAYMTSLDKFRELVNIEDEKIQRQIPKVFMKMRNNPKYKEMYGSMVGNSDSMSVDLMREIYHCLLDVNDMNSYEGIKINPVDYIFLSDEKKKTIRHRVLFQLRVKFEKMSSKKLSKFLIRKSNLFLLDGEDKKDYLSRARNIILNSIDITEQIIDDEEVLEYVEKLLGRRTPTAIFEFVNNAQVSRYMHRKMHGENLDLRDTNNLFNTQRTAAEYWMFKEEQRKAKDKTNSNFEGELSDVFDVKLKELISDSFSYLSQKYSDTISSQELYEKIINYFDEFIINRNHDYRIFDGLTLEMIEQAIFGFNYMFDEVPEKKAIIARKL